MYHALLATLVMLVGFALPATAQERVTLGLGRLFTNDTIGDGQDRWQTGAYVASWVRGSAGTVDLPERFGEVMEYRFSSRMMTPDDLTTPAPGDRLYAGVLSVGAYTHFSQGGFDLTAGSEMVVSGPMTRLAKFQTGIHDLLGIAAPSAAVQAGQIGNAVYPVLGFEAARPIVLGEVGGAVLRPFVQGRAGDETYLRAGVDLLVGPDYAAGVLARDETTGIPYQTLPRTSGRGWSFLLGADSARVFDSAWLPATGGPTATAVRNRARAGVRWQGERFGAFYGATWLGPEFAGQSRGQVVGSLSLRWQF